SGDGAAGASTTRFYLVGATSVLLTGTHAVPGLPAGNHSSSTVGVTIPSTTPLGTYSLAACADDLQVVSERNEGNNCKTALTSIQVAPPTAPDLVETAVSNPPAVAIPGASFTVTDTAKNQGDAAAAASTTRYYLSLDTVKDPLDTLIAGSRAVPGLAIGATSTGTVTVAIP